MLGSEGGLYSMCWVRRLTTTALPSIIRISDVTAKPTANPLCLTAMNIHLYISCPDALFIYFFTDVVSIIQVQSPVFLETSLFVANTISCMRSLDISTSSPDSSYSDKSVSVSSKIITSFGLVYPENPNCSVNISVLYMVMSTISINSINTIFIVLILLIIFILKFILNYIHFLYTKQTVKKFIKCLSIKVPTTLEIYF